MGIESLTIPRNPYQFQLENNNPWPTNRVRYSHGWYQAKSLIEKIFPTWIPYFMIRKDYYSTY